MDLNNQNNKCYITFDLINKLLNDLEGFNESFKNNKDNKIIEFSKKFEFLYKVILMKRQKSFHSLKRKIIYFGKFVIKRKAIKFKKNSYENINHKNSLLYFIIPILKIFIENKNHMSIRKMLLILIKFFEEKIFPYELFTITIELILNIVINILKSNKDSFFYINDEPFNIINDIIIGLISYPDEIKIENPNAYILTDIINAFDKYLFSQCHTNIIFTETPIWLKLLEIKFFIPFNQEDTTNGINDSEVNKNIEIQKKLYSFLVKIYKFSMSND